MDMIRLGCHSKNFGPDTPENTLSFIQKLGFEYVSIDPDTIKHAEAVANPEKTAQHTKDLLEKFGLQAVEYIMGGLRADGKGYSAAELSASTEDAVFNDFDKVCKYAKLAGFSSVMGSAGEVVKDLGYERTVENTARTFQKLVQISKDNGVVFNVEPGQRSILNSPQKALDMVQRVSGLTYTLDILHFQVHGYPTEESLKLLPYTSHMHARQAATGWNKCPVEFGEIDYDLVVKRLRGMFWDGVITMEFWLTPPELAGKMSAVEQTIVMRYQLKQLIRKYWSGMLIG